MMRSGVGVRGGGALDWGRGRVRAIQLGSVSEGISRLGGELMAATR